MGAGEGGPSSGCEAVAQILEKGRRATPRRAPGCLAGLVPGAACFAGLAFGLGWHWVVSLLAGLLACAAVAFASARLARRRTIDAVVARVAAAHDTTPADLYPRAFQLLAGRALGEVGHVLRALDATAYARDEGVLQALEGRWQDVDVHERDAEAHRERLEEALIDLAGHHDPDLRLAAGRALERLGATAWADLLPGAEADLVRIARSDAYGAHASLRAAIRGESVDACTSAVRALAERKGDPAIELLRQALAHRHPEVARAAAETLSHLGKDPTRFRPKGTPPRPCPRCGAQCSGYLDRVGTTSALATAVATVVLVGAAAALLIYTGGLAYRAAAVLAIVVAAGVVCRFIARRRGRYALKMSCPSCRHTESFVARHAARWEQLADEFERRGSEVPAGVLIMYQGGAYRSTAKIRPGATATLRSPDRDKDRWEYACALHYEALPGELKDIWFYG